MKLNRLILEEAYPYETPKKLSNHVMLNPTMISALIKICHDGEEPYITRVREILGNLHDPDVIEILCDYLILNDDPDPILLNIFREKGYGPKDESKKAMYFFITEQWGNYENHDFQEDRPLLRKNYTIISDNLRKKVMVSARKGGKTAILMKALIGHGKRHKIHEMGDEEWSSIIEYLRKNCRWDDLWKLLLITPIEWSSEILIILSNAEWKGKEKSGLFEELLNLCPKEGNNLKIIDLQYYMTFAGVPEQLNNLIITQNGRYLIGMDIPGTKIWIWNLRDGTLLKEISTGLSWAYDRICLSPNDKILVLFSPVSNYQKALYEMPSGKLIKSIPSDNIFVISKNSKTLFTYSGIWQIPEGTLIRSFNNDSDRKSKYLLITSDEQILINVRHYDDEIHLWQLTDGTYIKSLEGHCSDITGLAISPDGTILISSSKDSIRIWRLPKGENISAIEGQYNSQYNCISFNHDGRTASCCRSEGRIQIFGVPEGNILANIKANQGRIRNLQYAHDGKILMSKGSDGTIKCWNLSNYKNFLTISSNNLFPPVVGSDGKIFAFIDDNKIQIWQLYWIKPLAFAGYDDLEYVQKVLHERPLDEDEKKKWQFLEAMLKAKFRFDINLDEKVISLGEYDIEINN